MGEKKNKTVDQCEVQIIPDALKGWKLRVRGCKREISEIEERLGPHSRAYLRNRLIREDP